MTQPDPAWEIAEAERSATAARERVSHTLAALQFKLNPGRLARQAVRDATDRSGAAAMAGAESVRRNPSAAAGIAALAGLFLARRKIAKLFRRSPKHPAKALPSPTGTAPVTLDPHGGEPTSS